MRALIVDDSRAMRMILRRMLAGAGFEVHEAENGRVGLDQFSQVGPIDLALVDWNMPEMNGLELVQAVRSEPDYAGTRIVMVSTESDTTHLQRALEAGADDYVMKPFTADAVQDKLALLGLDGGSAA